jgi:Holliday junction resolvase
VKSPVKEKWVKAQVVKMLKDIEAYYFYPVANGYMSSGVPDIVACVNGKFVGIECKAGDNKPTALQTKNLLDITNAGGTASVINENSLDDLKQLLKELNK